MSSSFDADRVSATAPTGVAGGVRDVQLWVVPHAHWDREWYLPFQRFRLLLVDALDEVFEMLDSEPDFSFTLDGQMAALEDYLEVRPEREPDVRRHVGSGRLAIGPWTVLMDEFLVDGETIVRNLQRGIRVAEDFGGAMRVGYLPDMFGHIAQMPQMLCQAGIERAVVWRGVPSSVDRYRFQWSSPDGSSVVAEYLLDGYGQAFELLTDADDPARAASGYVRDRSRFAATGQVLAMTGADHLAPGRAMLEAAAQVRAHADAPDVRVDTVASYLAGVPDDPHLPRWRGELRSAANANLLPGVTSNRVDVRLASKRAEDALGRLAEPLLAAHADEWPGRLLETAWTRVIVNSAHDSVCACSIDEVVDQVLVRYAEARQIGEGLVAAELKRRAPKAPSGGVLVANSRPRRRSGLVEMIARSEDVDHGSLRLGDGTDAPLQLLDEVGGDVVDLLTDAQGVRDHIAVRHGRELMGGLISEIEIEGAEPLTVLIWIDQEPRPVRLDVERALEPVEEALRATPGSCRLVVRRRPRRRVLTQVSAPPLGYTTAAPVAATPVTVVNPVTVTGSTLDNRLVRCAVRDDGLLDLHAAGEEAGLIGLGELVDGGDVGDTYNYGPPTNDRLVRTPERVDVRVLEYGPLRASIEVSASYRWPRDAGDLRSRPEPNEQVDIRTALELRADEPFVRVGISFDNACDDHRLRVHLPIPDAVEHSYAEGHYAVLPRGLVGEGGHGELPLATFPAHGFVAVPGLAVLLDRVMEYEVIDGGSTLALTLLRATGWMSRNHNPGRRDPAAAEIEIPGAQVHGPQEIAFALRPFTDPAELGQVLLEAEDFRLPLVSEPGTGGPDQGSEDAGPEIRGDGVVMTALQRVNGELEVRLSNPLDAPTTALVRADVRSARVVDLRGQHLHDLPIRDGDVAIDLDPYEFRTVRLTTVV